MSIVASFLLLAAASAADPVQPATSTCAQGSEDDVVVCGERTKSYRIDPLVLEADRQAAAKPVKPPLDASATVAGADCIGPQKCGDKPLPLVAVALAAVKAAALAAASEDWKQAFRNGPTDYDRYQGAKEAKKKPKVRIAFGSGPK